MNLKNKKQTGNKINKQKKFGVIGHPIEHSMSAIMHNAVFRKLNLPYTYKLFDILPENLESFIKNSKDLTGINVTIPHKVAVIKYLDKLDRTAQLVGAANTIKFNKEIIGYTTDGIGCIKALEEENVDIKNKNILIIGSGGASRSIIFQLIDHGGKLSISNRTKEKAKNLIQEIKDKTGKDTNLIEYKPKKLKQALSNKDILINATSVGMYPNINETPLPIELLNKNLIVMDLVYNPIKTKLLEEAKKIGCKTISGTGMLIHQGAESLKIWLEINPPIKIMRDALINALTTPENKLSTKLQ